ncbi:bacteriocin ABC transporter ATP-binding protein, partial [Pseudomonas aeruginosa]
TGDLDPETGQLIIQLLLNLVDEHNILIMATHDMNIAAQCDEVIDLTKLA